MSLTEEEAHSADLFPCEWTLSADLLSLFPSRAITAAEMRELMIREMNHRVKNLFAIIGGMVGAGSRGQTGVVEFAKSMRYAGAVGGAGA